MQSFGNFYSEQVLAGKIPSFSYMGGKSRMRNWLIQHFPKSGDTYLEPFAGAGNVFFAARKVLNFKFFHVNDLNNSKFFDAIRTADLSQLPDKVTRDDFHTWKNKGDDISRLIEPRITFGGKGFKHGFNGGNGSHKGYDGKLYRKNVEAARDLMSNVILTDKSWDQLGIQGMGSQDFVYLDPPYLNTKAHYANIDHEKLIGTLNSSGCRWAISGYESDLYDGKLKFTNRYVFERNSEIKSAGTGARSPVSEILWTNY